MYHALSMYPGFCRESTSGMPGPYVIVCPFALRRKQCRGNSVHRSGRGPYRLCALESVFRFQSVLEKDRDWLCPVPRLLKVLVQPPFAGLCLPSGS